MSALPDRASSSCCCGVMEAARRADASVREAGSLATKRAGACRVAAVLPRGGVYDGDGVASAEADRHAWAEPRQDLGCLVCVDQDVADESCCYVTTGLDAEGGPQVSP
jgi:hypothetical protein